MTMDMNRNLSTPEKRQLFRDKFRKLVETYARSLCGDARSASLLTEDVFLRVELEYREQLLPSYCEPFLAGRVNLAYAMTGGKTETVEADISRLQRLMEKDPGPSEVP